MSIILAFVVITSNYVGVSSMTSESKLIYFTLLVVMGILTIITL